MKIERAIDVIHMQNNIETRKLFDVIHKLFDAFRFNKYIRGEDNDFYDPVRRAEIMTFEPIGNQTAKI